MNITTTIRCYQCGAVSRFTVLDAITPQEAAQVKQSIEAEGWWEHGPGMRFCPSCRRSARLSLGVDAGTAG